MIIHRYDVRFANYENILFKDFFEMNPLNFEVVTDEVAKNILPIEPIENNSKEGDVICCLIGGDIITLGHKLYRSKECVDRCFIHKQKFYYLNQLA